jgi:hypothetical protein
MATWKKVIVSGSNAELNQITASGGINATLPSAGQANFVAYNSSTGQFSYYGTGSFTAATASYVTSSNVFGPFGSNSILSASNASTASRTAGTLSTVGSGGISISTNFNGSADASLSLNGYAGFNSNGILKWNGTSFTNSTLTDDGTTVSTAANIQAAGSNSSLTGSFSGSHFGNLTGTASYATTASYALNIPATASYASQANTASFALTSSYAVNAQTASYVLQAVSASYAGSTNNIAGAIANNTDNYILTAQGTGVVNGESNLTFNGTLLTVTGNATITGDLTVAGTASFTNTDNLNVRDKFILINSGSTTLADSGWVTQYNAAGSGSAFYLESTSAGTYGRFAVAYDTVGTSTSVTADEYVVTAKVNQSAPGAATPTWGGSGTNGQGNMWLTSTGDIYIWA